ncbi:MAG: ribonuclease III [Blastocatellia bacterium]|nr:ribonuclease III [Blastocatellia bacterium]MCS7157409.1 ribonuclease III [Blastocatellia bacterium]MCX7752583.1 ribonuclease III [Blastocatellia bacterium]MDW8168314.1 ribonuclease III [Acidobacteriota bacterium]MDW8255510.1 ribonuclease III [Acidobacteriota bacterium]
MPTEARDLSELERKIGYTFRRRELLNRALTHRSYAHEIRAMGLADNEALEFLGDAVLGFIVSAWLFELFPALPEGKLAKMKAFLVSAENLQVHARNLQLGEYLRLNRGEEKTGGRTKRTLLVDAYEALIAALYLDGGIEVAEAFVRRQFQDIVCRLDPESVQWSDYKTTLQEQLQARGLPPPVYEVIGVEGPAHARRFQVSLRIGERVVATGEGPTIKAAHQHAARVALGQLEQLLEIPASEATP